MMVVGLLLNNVDVYVIILVEIKDDFDEVLVVLVFLLQMLEVVEVVVM